MTPLQGEVGLDQELGANDGRGRQVPPLACRVDFRRVDRAEKKGICEQEPPAFLHDAVVAFLAKPQGQGNMVCQAAEFPGPRPLNRGPHVVRVPSAHAGCAGVESFRRCPVMYQLGRVFEAGVVDSELDSWPRIDVQLVSDHRHVSNFMVENLPQMPPLSEEAK